MTAIMADSPRPAKPIKLGASEKKTLRPGRQGRMPARAIHNFLLMFET